MSRTPNGCPFPEVAPSYLPWLDDGETQEPTRERFAGEARLIWEGDSDAPDALVVLKALASGEWDPTGLEPVPVTVNGWRGYMSFGGNFSDDTADHAIIWQTEHQGRLCNMLVLVHWDPGMSTTEGVEEINKMALSLRPAP